MRIVWLKFPHIYDKYTTIQISFHFVDLIESKILGRHGKVNITYFNSKSKNKTA